MSHSDDLAPGWRLVAAKELGDLLGRLGRGAVVRTLLVVAFVGVVVPVRFPGAANLPAFFAVFMAFVPARLVALDAYAGERERGTLEPLLASPYPDGAILAGKLAAATVYGTVRGWLFLAVWAASAAALRATSLVPEAPVPSAAVFSAVVVGAGLIAYAAAVYGLWQSATAPSVRAIVESGGLLRLVLVVGTFFGAPYVLGLLSPDGRAPTIGLPGSQDVSLQVLTDELARRPAEAVVGAGVVAAVAAICLALLTRAASRRARREVLATVGTSPAPPARHGRPTRLWTRLRPARGPLRSQTSSPP